MQALVPSTLTGDLQPQKNCANDSVPIPLGTIQGGGGGWLSCYAATKLCNHFA